MAVILPLMLCLVSPWIASAQFPAICNTEQALQSKICCPNNCSEPTRGTCENITEEAATQLQNADPAVINILRMAPQEMEKGTADAHFMWPTVVFEKVCICKERYGGVGCNECDFGWTGIDCSTKKSPVTRKGFSRLSTQEKETFVDATRDLKREMGVWSVVVEEPRDYTTGTVTLQNVSTYDFFIYLHDYVARDGGRACRTTVDMGTIIDFAHSGPVFPVWHRRYLLTVEKEFQRITGNSSFGFPYWQWEQNDTSPFTEEYYGVPSHNPGGVVNVNGRIINPNDWNTICDLSYWNRSLDCSAYWKPCNPANDLAEQRPLQRGNESTYLPNIFEVMIAIAAPSYDAADSDEMYSRNSTRASFRSRLEGWNIICSAANCTGPRDFENDHMHNNVHDWVGGQMDDVPAAVNDPIFNLHHCNVDRILESWMQRFVGGDSTDFQLLPAYVPVRGGHPGHNRDDYMVPFFPLITAGRQYRIAEEWGYVYDELIPANIRDDEIPDCEEVTPNVCPICDANSTCIDCNGTFPFLPICPAPNAVPETGGLNTGSTASSQNADTLGVGLGLGLPLFAALVVIAALVAILIYTVFKKRSDTASDPSLLEMTVVS